jgi:hypothetical protein
MKTIVTAFLISLSAIAFAQVPPITIEPYGGNKRASVSEQIGIVKIEINYNRPGVKGREGKIWNTPVAHYGFVDLGHGTSYAAPWRAGANENTTMSFSHPVKIEGQDLPAGKYGFFISLGEAESTLIFSKVNNSWGSFYYDETQDALRVKVKNQMLDKSVEWLTYSFSDEVDSSAVIAMSWEKRKIAFRVDVERKKLQIEAFKSDFRITRPTSDFIEAADWCVRNNYDLVQALAWMDRGIYFRVMGEKNFRSLSEKAKVLTKMNRADEARKLMEEAIPLGNMVDVHFYARTLLADNLPKEAFKVFKSNYDKNPQEYTTNVGMARAHSGLGEYKKGLPYLKAALPKAPDDANKTRVETMIKQLESSQDINK